MNMPSLSKEPVYRREHYAILKLNEIRESLERAKANTQLDKVLCLLPEHHLTTRQMDIIIIAHQLTASAELMIKNLIAELDEGVI